MPYGPPGVPPARVEALRAAFADAMNDPAFKADAEQAKLNARYVSPAEIGQVLADAYKATPDVVALTKKAFGR